MKNNSATSEKGKKKEQENITILKGVVGDLVEMDFHPTFINDILYICDSCSVMITKSKTLDISFELGTHVNFVAHVMKILVNYAKRIDSEVDIYEFYLNVFDEEGEYVTTLYDNEAEHYHETGEYTIKEVKKIEIDPSKKVDEILDKVSSKGLKALDKDEKKFLLDHSKEHKH
jgi:hypothetical protein